MALGVRNDNLAALAGTDGDYSPFQVNAEGAVYSTLGGYQSSGNTSTTPLGSSATFTGTGELNEYPDVIVSCQTDNTGTLYFDFSVDGTNWNTFPVNGFSVASGVHEFHTGLKGPRYFRVRLVNDAGAQTYLRLYTYYGNFSKIPNAPLNQAISTDSDAVITNSVLAADNGSNFVNIGATAAGNLKVAVEEISDGLDIGAGNAGTETLRVSVSTDDVNLSAIKTATELLDNAIGTENAATPTSAMLSGGRYDATPRTLGDGDIGAIALDADGAVQISDGGNTITVDGTVTANAGTGPFTVDNGGTFAVQAAQSGTWNVTNISGTVSLPTGAATETTLSTVAGDTTSLDGKFSASAALADNFANPTTTGVGAFSMLYDGATWDRAPGNATDGLLVNLGTNNDITGTVTANAGTGTFTVDNGGTFAVQAAVDELPAAAAAADTFANPTTTSVLGMGMLYNGTTWDRVRGDTTNGLDVDVTRVSGTVTVDGSGVTQPVSGTVTANLSATDNTVLDNIDTNTDYGQVTGGGTETGALRVTIANDSTGVITVDNAGTFATQATLQTGSNLACDVGLSGARTSGGTTLYKNIDVDETEDQIKGSAGQVYWIHAMNLSSSTRFLKLYNATSATVVVGTTTPDLTFPIPTQGDTNGAGFTLSIPNGIAFGTAITIAATTGVADNDSGAPGANEVIVNLGYA